MHSCRMTLESTVVEIGKWSEDFIITKPTIPIDFIGSFLIGTMPPKNVKRIGEKVEDVVSAGFRDCVV